jgi:hypothetical protein
MDQIAQAASRQVALRTTKEERNDIERVVQSAQGGTDDSRITQIHHPYSPLARSISISPSFLLFRGCVHARNTGFALSLPVLQNAFQVHGPLIYLASLGF